MDTEGGRVQDNLLYLVRAFQVLSKVVRFNKCSSHDYGSHEQSISVISKQVQNCIHKRHSKYIRPEKNMLITSM